MLTSNIAIIEANTNRYSIVCAQGGGAKGWESFVAKIRCVYHTCVLGHSRGPPFPRIHAAAAGWYDGRM